MTTPDEASPSPGPDVRLVVFDMDDVLLRYDVEARRAAIGRLAGLPHDEIERRIWTSGIEDASDAGRLSADGYLDAVAAALGAPFGRREWHDTRRLAMTLDPAVVALAARVGARVPIALLTNNGFIMKEHFDALVPELRALFGPSMHVAAEFDTKKPDPAIYRRLAALHGVDPAAAVMIDDKATNVDGARAAGLRAHHFTHASRLETFLGGLGLL
ncbi:HAD family hydrolase [Ancylobacter amanitiformis]|uniref:Hydrolase of the HAD superfamily n=1 Tax=Ancylobacter amanitiformis TaxID=217069 RepID=A0ABU0LSM1_9HYPH|nr:HAD family phosphatase [Ancylobacter amanitiformis]MDQ0511691.1 putative hydrolase of the HAD superfamily [Ancylobacter amanitiformis]